jgi:KaiC/GvpD/RAD55 family RecA-like ATPase
MALERVRTGIEGLDVLLSGGLIPKRSYIVAGPPGSGKTLFAIQFLAQGTKEKKRSLYITINEPPNELKMNLQYFNMDVKNIHVIDSIPDVKSYDVTVVKDVSSVRAVENLSAVSDVIRKTPEFKALEASIPSLQQTLKQVCQQKGYERIVIDSLTALLYYALKGEDERASVQSFMRFMMDLDATIMLTVESNTVSPYEPYVFLSRGAIRLWKWWDEGKLCRAISVEKFKGSEFDEVPRVMEITKDGIVVHLEKKANLPSLMHATELGHDDQEEEEEEERDKVGPFKNEKTINPYLKRDMG